MGSKLLVFALITSVVVSGALNMINSAFAQTPVWYPGEGVKQGMYVKYRIEDYDTNERQPYVLTLYFQQQDQDGNWIVPAYVEANGRVLQGTLKLSQGMSPLAGGEVPQEMSPFIGGYQNSLLWLDAASSIFEPLSLTAGSWGKIASIGGQEVKPAGSEQVQFAGAQSLCGAPSCDATRISWRKGVDSNVWVVNEFPFPVKAQTYADVTTPPQPIQYAFELLETGSGQPPAPTATGEAPRPPLDRTTTDGSHVILTWNPVDIQPNSAVNFGVEFRDANNAPLNGVSYDFLAKDANGPIIQQLSDQYAQTGISSQQVTFNSPGPKTILITINAVGSRPTGQLIESTDFNIVVAGTNSTTGGAAGGTNSTTAGTNATTAGTNATTAGTNATTAGTNATTGGAAGSTNATIPEFSTVAIVVLAIAIIGIIIATSRQGRFSFGQRM